MSLLYPRLLPAEANRLFEVLHQVPSGAHENMVAYQSTRAVFAATGGQRASRDDLQRLRLSVLAVARAQGYPEEPTNAQGAAFDRAVARVLHEQSLLIPGEAAQRQIWAFLALVLLPDVCTWRWPAKPGKGYTGDRFKSTDLTRHALGRLWTRAHVLRDPDADDPYHLLAVMGEADLDQIMARRSALAGSPALVRSIVRAHAEDPRDADGVPSRTVFRQSLIRLLRLTAFMDLDAASATDLYALVRGVRADTRRALEH
ncbi:hypothetical protein DN069_20330 [Streptacidiphilus pinicola]|uniref:Uncharacterized protein n=1 Tax=Streptacidiphilus pinicola TaxID=2219663 RepID=A0A2X0K8E4_9ACTN|nr:DUF6339 family protein [Streptacidiphilus pinicola]RAG83789.1 hypothetical protein DN069_20330 [Streptacidiphilus pinicola]